MKKLFILLSVFIITLIAFVDAKDRFKELDEVAANTPSQVELKQMINSPDAQMRKDTIQQYDNSKTIKENLDKDNRQMQQNQLQNVDKRRDTIKNQVQ